MCSSPITRRANQWRNPHETIHQKFHQCLMEMEEYFEQLHANIREQQLIKALYKCCVTEAVYRVIKMNNRVHDWKAFATMLSNRDLKRNMTALRIVRDLTQKKHDRVKYLQHSAQIREARASELFYTQKLEAMGVYLDDDSSDDGDSSEDESWEDIVAGSMDALRCLLAKPN